MILKKILLAALLSFPLLSNAQSTNTNNPFVLNPTNNATVPPFPPNSGQYWQSNVATHSTFVIETNAHWKSVDENGWTNKIATNGVISIQNSTGTSKFVTSNGDLSISGIYTGLGSGISSVKLVEFPQLPYGQETNVVGEGESFIAQLGAGYPLTANTHPNNATNMGLVAQVGSELGLPWISWGQSGVTAMRIQWDEVMNPFGTPGQFPAGNLFVITESQNDIVGNGAVGTTNSLPVSQSAMQVMEASLAFLSCTATNQHPRGIDFLSNLGYGVTNSGSQWSNTTGQSWYQPTCLHQGILTQHQGDTVTWTNAVGPFAIIGLDCFYKNPGLSSSAVILVDGVSNQTVNLTNNILGFAKNADTSTQSWSNAIIPVAVSLAVGTHSLTVSNPGPLLGVEFMVSQGKESYHPPIFYLTPVNQPANVNGQDFTNLYISVANMWATMMSWGFTNIHLINISDCPSNHLADGVHPDFYESHLIARRVGYSYTGSYEIPNSFSLSYLPSNIVQVLLTSVYGYNTNTWTGANNFLNLSGNGGGLTNVLTFQSSSATSGTVILMATNQVQTAYLSSGSTISSVTIALPTSGYAGQTFYIHSKSAVTTLSVTGGSFLDSAVTSMSAGQTIGYQNTSSSGAYLRLQ